MAITRRQFITRTGVAAAGSFLGSGLFRNPLLRQALADTIGDRYFVVLFLDGGNDGLNTITPADNVGGLRTAYNAARNTGSGGLQLAPGSLLVPTSPAMKDPNTGAQLGFHPGLQGLKNLYDQGQVAVIQGCGYPNYNTSHEVSRSIWQVADPLGAAGYGTGWMGRYLAANYTGSQIPGVCVRGEVAREFVQYTTSVLAIEQLKDFGFPYDDFLSGDEQAKRDAFSAIYGQAKAATDPLFKYVGDSGSAMLTASESYPPLHNDYHKDRKSFEDAYNAVGRSTARDLLEIAKVIYGVKRGVPNVNARFFEISNGGYDTHSDQGGAETDGQQYGLHKEVGDSLQVFFNDLQDMGVASKTCVMVWSEFSRRIEQNDNGTDHGSQGPMFVIGGAVHGGVYGNHPNIADLDGDGNTKYSQDTANGFRSTDLRDVYGTILKHWLGMTNPSAVLPVDGGDPKTRWTAPSYDMGFL